MQFLQGRDSSSKLAYSQLLTDIKDSKVTTVEICQGEITAKYKDDTSKKVNATSISVEDLRKGIKDENLDPLKINIKECSNFSTSSLA